MVSNQTNVYGWVWGAFTSWLVAIRLGDGGSSSEGRSPVCTWGTANWKTFFFAVGLTDAALGLKTYSR